MEVNIPITGQSFGVLLVPYVLGTKEGMITILLYLILGLLGMPIFAEGSSGWASFTSNSGGYLVGFLVGGMFSGCVSGKFENTIWASLSAMFFGTFSNSSFWSFETVINPRFIKGNSVWI